MAQFLQDKKHKFQEVATSLQMQISFEAHDFFAADVFYRNSCYIKFSVKRKDEQIEKIQNDILE